MRTDLTVDEGSSESENLSISAVLHGTALFRLTDQMLLGPFGRIDEDALGTLGLRLRLVDL